MAYEPKMNMYQNENSVELIFEDIAFKDANATLVTSATLTVQNEEQDIDVTIDIAHDEGIHVDTPYNGYQATITAYQLGLPSGSTIKDGIYEITYEYNYTIDGSVETASLVRRFALYAQVEREVFMMFKDIYKHYTCDKPWASTYIMDTLTARALVKALETSAYMGFEDDYANILNTLNKILINNGRNYL